MIDRFVSLLIYLFIYQQGVEVRRAPRFLTPIGSKSKLYFINRGVRLDCLADGDPLPVIRWFHSNTLLQSSSFCDVFSNGTLFIRPFTTYIKSFHSSSFVCRAENGVGIVQTLPIQLKPQIDETYEIDVKTPYGFDRSSVILSCEISPLSANLYIRVIGWIEKINEKIIELDLKPRSKYNFLANGDLIIHHLSESDDRRSYSCLVRNLIDNSTRQSSFKLLRVRAFSPFSVELSISNNTIYHVKDNDLVELPCGIASISSQTTISWWKDQVELIDVNDQLYDHSLIRRVSFNDSGNYLCQVKDPSISSLISLQVHLSIRCEINIEEANLNVGSNLELICRTNSMKSQWQWYHNAVRLSNDDHRYFIENLSREKMGVYQCCSIDEESCCAQTEIRVINSPPVLIRSDELSSKTVVVVYPLVSIDFNCTFYGDPTPQIDLLKNGRKLDTNRSILLPSGDVFLHYSIQLSKLEDTGLYECLATNSFGSTSFSQHFNFREQKPFIEPMENQTIRPNQSFTLFCFASGFPHLHLQWIDQGTNEIVNRSKISPLLWTSIGEKSKRFVCHAINSHGNSSAEIFLHVQNLPDRIENLFIENLKRIFWMKPFDGNSEILQYLLRIQFQQGSIWSNETIITVNDGNITNYSLENLLSPCRISLRIQAVNRIGISLPSDAIQFQTNIKELRNPPSNINVIELTSTSVTLSWEYPFFEQCNDSLIEFYIDIDRRILRTSEYSLKIDDLNSFTDYSLTIYAKSRLGSSPKSKSLRIQTLESVPLAMIDDLSATLLNSSTLHISWTMAENQFHLLHGRFRSFTLMIYLNHNMSTLMTIETNETELILFDLSPSSHYFLSMTICNYLDCGPSSSVVVIETPPSIFEVSETIVHPINKPLLLDCPSSTNNSIIFIPQPTLSETKTDYQCQSKRFQLRFYDKPSSIQVTIHYTTSNEIGLKIIFPLEMIESLTINYKIVNESHTDELISSPAVFNVRLRNLSCGTIYQLMVYASNRAGFSRTQSLLARTKGSIPSLIDPSTDVIETRSNHSIIISLNNWFIHQCPILSYEISVWRMTNQGIGHLDRHFLLRKDRRFIEINRLGPNRSYQFHIKVHTEAGTNRQIISYRTDFLTIDSRPEKLFLPFMIIIGSFLLTILVFFTTILVLHHFRVRQKHVNPYAVTSCIVLPSTSNRSSNLFYCKH